MAEPRESRLCTTVISLENQFVKLYSYIIHFYVIETQMNITRKYHGKSYILLSGTSHKLLVTSLNFLS